MINEKIVCKKFRKKGKNSYVLHTYYSQLYETKKTHGFRLYRNGKRLPLDDFKIVIHGDSAY